MSFVWWKNTLPRALADHHPVRYLRAKIGHAAMRLRRSSSASPQLHSPRGRAGPLTGRWWDTSDDETLLWQENEHIERSHRMQELEQGLDKLRDTRSEAFRLADDTPILRATANVSPQDARSGRYSRKA